MFCTIRDFPALDVFLYFSRPELILTRSVSEEHNSFPRLRFGLVRDVSLSTARSIARDRSGANSVKREFDCARMRIAVLAQRSLPAPGNIWGTLWR